MTHYHRSTNVLQQELDPIMRDPVIRLLVVYPGNREGATPKLCFSCKTLPSEQPLVAGVQAGYGSILVWPTLTLLFGNKHCSSPHKPYGDIWSINLHPSPHDFLQPVTCLVEFLPPEPTNSIMTWCLPAFQLSGDHIPNLVVGHCTVL